MTLPRITSRDLRAGDEPRDSIGIEESDSPFVAIMGRFVAWAGVAFVGSIGVLFAAVVIGLAIRIFLAVSGVASP